MRKVPEIRLKGYEGEWEEFPFASQVDRLSIMSNEQGLPRVEYEDINSGKGTLNKDVFTKHSTKVGLLFEPNDILFGKLRPYLNNVLLATFKGLAVGDFWIYRSKGDCSFLYYLMQTGRYSGATKQTTGTKMPRADWKVVSNYSFFFPILKEQQSIGSFFSSFDRLITEHQQRLENLRRVKKSMLQKMFPKQGQAVPEIRFKGFEGEWKKARLSTFIMVSNEVNSDNFYGIEDVLSVSGDYGVVNQIEFQGRSFAGASVAGYGIAETGDVIYTKSPLKSNPYGIIKTNKGKPGIVSVLYGVYHPIAAKTDSSFIQTYFESDARLNNYLRTLINKGSKNTLLISDEDALNGIVCFPSYKEQQQIASFFTSLDNLINQEVKYIDQLNCVKRTLLQKMFV